MLPQGPLNYTVSENEHWLSAIDLRAVRFPLNSFPLTLLYVQDSHAFIRGSHFNRAAGPLVLLLPDPQEINEYVALRWPLCISTHQKHRGQVARVQDDRKTIPPFISRLQPPTSLPPEQDPGNPREKRVESLRTKVTRDHKVQLSPGLRGGSKERN